VMPNADVVQTLEYISIVSSAIYIINIPVSFLLFSNGWCFVFWKLLMFCLSSCVLSPQNYIRMFCLYACVLCSCTFFF
jgi:hypothetical protein